MRWILLVLLWPMATFAQGAVDVDMSPPWPRRAKNGSHGIMTGFMT